MKYVTLLALSLGFVVVQLDVTVVNVATKTIGSSIGGSISGLQWVVNAYTLTFASMILTAGAMGDRIGAKKVFITGFSIFTIASIGCALAPSLPFLIAARAVQGIGASILVPCSLALLNHTYESPDEKTRAVAIWAAGASVAIAIGPVVGGLLIGALGWRSIFYINVPIGCLGIWLTIRHTSETPSSHGRNLDMKGQLTAIVSLVLLAASLIQGGKQGWSDHLIIGGLILFGVFLAVFILIESKTAQPMLPLSMFRNKTFSATAIIGFLINIGIYGLIFILSLFLQQLKGYSPLTTGLAFLPLMIMVFVANLIAPRASRLIGPKWLIFAGGLIFFAGCLLLTGIGRETGYASMVPGFTIIGFGAGLIVPPMTSATLASVDKSQSGIASGVLNSMRQTGSVVGVALFGSLIAKQGQFVQGLHLSLYISAAIFLVAVLSALRIDASNG